MAVQRGFFFLQGALEAFRRSFRSTSPKKAILQITAEPQSQFLLGPWHEMRRNRESPCELLTEGQYEAQAESQNAEGSVGLTKAAKEFAVPALEPRAERQ